MQTPWQRARNRRSQNQEHRLAGMPEGSRQPNSGRFWRWKRDNKLWNFLVEARTTESGSYTISKKEFEQIRREAITTPPGLKPGLQIDLGNVRLFVMELRDWEAVYTRLIELEADFAEKEIP